MYLVHITKTVAAYRPIRYPSCVYHGSAKRTQQILGEGIVEWLALYSSIFIKVENPVPSPHPAMPRFRWKEKAKRGRRRRFGRGGEEFIGLTEEKGQGQPVPSLLLCLSLPLPYVPK